MTAAASENVPGVIIGGISTAGNVLGAAVSNVGFIGSEFDKMKKWDETHSTDGSLKKLIILLI